jgi:hypothetical protein
LKNYGIRLFILIQAREIIEVWKTSTDTNPNEGAVGVPVTEILHNHRNLFWREKRSASQLTKSEQFVSRLLNESLAELEKLYKTPEEDEQGLKRPDDNASDFLGKRKTTSEENCRI